jgi:hypothetical protein
VPRVAAHLLRRALYEAHERHQTFIVVHHARKNGGSTPGGQSLRGSGDFFAWVDTALSLRRRSQHLALAGEHRAARAPDPVRLALVGTEQDLHLALVGAPDPPTGAGPAPADLDATLLHTLDQAGGEGRSRAALRAALHVRNARLGDALTRASPPPDTWLVTATRGSACPFPGLRPRHTAERERDHAGPVTPRVTDRR